MEQNQNKRLVIVYDKGASECTPVNTYASAQKCIKWNVDYMEIDVNISYDGVMYVFNGPSLQEFGISKNINEVTSVKIDEIDVGKHYHPRFVGEKIPRLEEFLEFVKGKVKIYFDIKLANVYDLLSLIKEKNIECFL